MQITILSATPDPMTTISVAAGTCYGKHDISTKRVVNCFNSGHMSVFEHAFVTFEIEGISRACSHQLVRHRLASYSQQSQRYCCIDVGNDDWYVTPQALDNSERFRVMMAQCAASYCEALKNGVNPEDARYLLPEATKTTIVVTMNLRELFHFLDVRSSKRVQWEIRDLAYLLEHKVASINASWAEIIGIRREAIERKDSDA